MAKTADPKTEWPGEVACDMLYEALMEEGHDRHDSEYPGASHIAVRLSRGKVVRTTEHAKKIWHGGLGSFIEVIKDPDGVGVYQMRMEPQVWYSNHLLDILTRKAKEHQPVLHNAQQRMADLHVALAAVKEAMADIKLEGLEE